ncbi:hypothetical protein V6Z11_D12G051800 [Gossypium hirsutum]
MLPWDHFSFLLNWKKQQLPYLLCSASSPRQIHLYIRRKTSRRHPSRACPIGVEETSHTDCWKDELTSTKNERQQSCTTFIWSGQKQKQRQHKK